MIEKSLYERLGGVFAIAAVIDHFSDEVVKNPKVGQGSDNPQLNEWSTRQLDRLPGLKFMRTLWVCDISGGPQKYVATEEGSTPLGLEVAHGDLRITPAEFDEVAAEFKRSLEHFNCRPRKRMRSWPRSPRTNPKSLRVRGPWPHPASSRAQPSALQPAR